MRLIGIETYFATLLKCSFILFPFSQMTKKNTSPAHQSIVGSSSDELELFMPTLKPFVWTDPASNPHTAAYQMQLDSFDDPASYFRFSPRPKERLEIHPIIIEELGEDLIMECLSRLQALARMHYGIHNRQHFQLCLKSCVLQFTDEGDDGRIIVDVHQKNGCRQCERVYMSDLVRDWVDMSLEDPKSGSGTGVCPIVRHNGKYYFFDERLRELRYIEPPCESIRFPDRTSMEYFVEDHCQQIT